MTIKLFSLFISVAVIYSCNNDTAVQQKNQPPNDNIPTATLDEKNETQFEENDCVFDTSTYKFTTAALKNTATTSNSFGIAKKTAQQPNLIMVTP